MNFRMVVRYAIRSGEERGGGTWNKPAMSPDVSPHVAVNGCTQREDCTVLERRHFQLAAIFPRMIRRHQMLATVFDPFDRLSQIDRGERDKKVFRIKLTADAEAAADIVFDKVQLVLRHFEKICGGLPIEMGQLGYAPNRQLSLAAVESGDQTSGFHRVAGESVHAKLFAPGVLRVLKSPICVANRKLMDSRAIAPGLFAQQDLVLQRCIDVYHC